MLVGQLYELYWDRFGREQKLVSIWIEKCLTWFSERPIRGTLFDVFKKKFSKSLSECARRPSRGTFFVTLRKNPGLSLLTPFPLQLIIANHRNINRILVIFDTIFTVNGSVDTLKLYFWRNDNVSHFGQCIYRRRMHTAQFSLNLEPAFLALTWFEYEFSEPLELLHVCDVAQGLFE